MVRISVGRLLEAPPDEVWRVIEPIESHVDWMADAVAIRFVGPQTSGLGTRFECDTAVGPFRMVDHMEITGWEPGRAMGVRHSGLVTGTGRFQLEDRPGGRTWFTWTERLSFPWYFGGPVGELFGSVVLRWIWERNLRGLARVLAARGITSGTVQGALRT